MWLCGYEIKLLAPTFVRCLGPTEVKDTSAGVAGEGLGQRSDAVARILASKLMGSKERVSRSIDPDFASS